MTSSHVYSTDVVLVIFAKPHITAIVNDTGFRYSESLSSLFKGNVAYATIRRQSFHMALSMPKFMLFNIAEMISIFYRHNEYQFSFADPAQ